MNIWSQVQSFMLVALPFLVVVAVCVVVLWLVNWLLLRRNADLGAEAKLPRQILLLVLSIAGLVLVIVVVPMSEATRSNILGLIGILLTGIIALSSTNFTGNIMAGLMLRVIKSFRSGDFIRIDDYFGRVTERGLVHTEIQNENRNLITFPNLYLVTHPVTVVRSSGTIVSTSLSLGYDVPRTRVEESLIRAAQQVGLQEPFVRVNDLGDYAVTYRIAGLLEDVKQLLSVRSDLRKNVMDALHADGIEIVSPTVMNQRPIPSDSPILPLETVSPVPRESAAPEAGPEAVIFDKAEEAETLERLQEELAAAKKRMEDLQKALKAAGKEGRGRLQAEIDDAARRIEQLMQAIVEAERKKRERNGSN